MIPKHAKLYSNGVKIAFFCEKSQTSHKMTPWPRAAAAYPQTLYVTHLVALVYSGRRSNDMFLIKFF